MATYTSTTEMIHGLSAKSSWTKSNSWDGTYTTEKFRLYPTKAATRFAKELSDCPLHTIPALSFDYWFTPTSTNASEPS